MVGVEMATVCLVYIPSRQPESHRFLFEISLEVTLKIQALGSHRGYRTVSLPAVHSILLLLHLNSLCFALTCIELSHCYPDITYQI